MRKESSKNSPLFKKAYKTWQNMKTRCNNPNTPYFYKYGGKGIKLSAEWENSFETFLQDVGIPPTMKHTIDRIDGLKGYTKDNCRWATYNEQNTNCIRANKTGYRGVTQHKNRKKIFSAEIKIDGLKISLGYFDTAEEAAHEYDKAALYYLGSFAIVNFKKESK